MNLCQTKSCFVCNRDVDGSGVLLSLETTSYSKTAFPTKLMQLLGDSFMVVILEDDKMCSRCANLINQTDKLEQDLRHIKSIIMGFLNEKYDLNREDEKLSSPLEEFQDPKEKNVFENQNLMQSPTIIVRHVDGETYQPNNSSKDIEESSGSNSQSSTISVRQIDGERYQSNNSSEGIEEFSQLINIKGENNFNGKINSKQVIDSDQSLNHTSFHNVSEISNSATPGALSYKLSDLGHRRKHSTLEFYRNESSQTFQESLKAVVLKEEIKETPPGYCSSVDGTNTSITSINNHHRTMLENSRKSLTVLETEHTREDKNKTKMKLSFKDSSFLKDLKDILITETVPEIELPKGITKLLSETIIISELSNITANSKSGEENKRQTISLKLATQSKNKKIESPDKTVKDLGQISAGDSNTTVVSSCLNTIKKSNIRIASDILNNLPDCDQTDKSISCNKNNTNKIKSLNSERETCSNQSILEEAEKVSSTSETPLVDLNTFCKVCNLYLKESKSCKCHENKHLQDGKNFSCSFCNKAFKSKSNLKCHEAVHTGKYSHFCEFCGQGFSKVDQFEEHRGTHTKEDRYICDVCGKMFNFHATYWIHRKWHDNPFPYKCNECGKPFKHSSHLSMHRRRKHTGERPYKCSYCPLTFNVSSTLKQHLVLHTKQYPFKCEMCDRGFIRRSRYIGHLARKHDIFVEKSSTRPKDYKMVVCDNMVEETEAKSLNAAEEIDFGESNCNIETVEKPELFSHNNLNDCQIEVILPSSSLISDNRLSDISWLT